MGSEETEDTDSPGTRRSGRKRTQTSFFQSKTVPKSPKPLSTEYGDRKRKVVLFGSDAEGSPEKKAKFQATEAASNDCHKRVTKVSPQPLLSIVPKPLPNNEKDTIFLGTQARHFDHDYSKNKLVVLQVPNKLFLTPPSPAPVPAKKAAVTTPPGLKSHVVTIKQPVMAANRSQLAPGSGPILHPGLTKITGNNLRIVQVRSPLSVATGPSRPQPVNQIQPKVRAYSNNMTVPVPRLPPPSLQDSRTLFPTLSCAPVNCPPTLKACGTGKDGVFSSPSRSLPVLVKSPVTPLGYCLTTFSPPGAETSVRDAAPVMRSKAATSHVYTSLSVDPSRTVSRQGPLTLTAPVSKPNSVASPPVVLNNLPGNYVIAVDPSQGVVRPVQQGSHSLLYLSKPNAGSTPPRSAASSVPCSSVILRALANSSKPNDAKATTQSTTVFGNPAVTLDQKWNKVAAQIAPDPSHPGSLMMAVVSKSNAALTPLVSKQTDTATSLSPPKAILVGRPPHSSNQNATSRSAPKTILVGRPPHSSNQNVSMSAPKPTAVCGTQGIKLEPADVSESSFESSRSPNGHSVPALTVGSAVTAFKVEPTDTSKKSEMFAPKSVSQVPETITTCPYPVGPPIPSALLQQSITTLSAFSAPCSNKMSKPPGASCVSSCTSASKTINICSVSTSGQPKTLNSVLVPALPAVKKRIAPSVPPGSQLPALSLNPTLRNSTCIPQTRVTRGMGLSAIPVHKSLNLWISSKVPPKPNVTISQVEPATAPVNSLMIRSVTPSCKVSNVSVVGLPQPVQVPNNVRVVVPVVSVQGNNMVSPPVCVQPASQLSSATNASLVPMTSLLSTSHLNPAEVSQWNGNPVTSSTLTQSGSHFTKRSGVEDAPMVSLLQSSLNTTQTLQNMQVPTAPSATASPLCSLLHQVGVQIQQDKLTPALSALNTKSFSIFGMTVKELLKAKTSAMEGPCSDKAVRKRVSKKRNHANTANASEPSEATTRQAKADVKSDPKATEDSSVEVLDPSDASSETDSMELVASCGEGDFNANSTPCSKDLLPANSWKEIKCVEAIRGSGSTEPTPSHRKGGMESTLSKGVAGFFSNVLEKGIRYGAGTCSDLKPPHVESAVGSTAQEATYGNIICCVCGKGFLNERSLRCHVEKSHRDWEKDSDFLETFQKHVYSMRSVKISVTQDPIKIVEPKKNIPNWKQNSECNSINSPTEIVRNQCDMCQREIIEKSSRTVDTLAACVCSDNTVSKRTRSNSKQLQGK